MRKEYDFSGAKKNPYASKLKKQVTISSVCYPLSLDGSFPFALR